MGSERRFRTGLPARCCQGAFFGLGFALTILTLAVMFWIAWCYFGLTIVQISESQRRAVVNYSYTSSKPLPSPTTAAPSRSTTISVEETSINAISKLPTTASIHRGSSRGESQVKNNQKKEATVISSLAKGDFAARDRATHESNVTALPSKDVPASAILSPREPTKTKEGSRIDTGATAAILSLSAEDESDDRVYPRRVLPSGTENRAEEKVEPNDRSVRRNPADPETASRLDISPTKVYDIDTISGSSRLAPVDSLSKEDRTQNRDFIDRDIVDPPRRDDIQSSRRADSGSVYREPDFEREYPRKTETFSDRSRSRYDELDEERGSRGRYDKVDRGRESDDRYSKGDTRVYPDDRETSKNSPSSEARYRPRERYPDDLPRRGDDDERYRDYDEKTRTRDRDTITRHGDLDGPLSRSDRNKDDDRYKSRDDERYRDDDRYRSRDDERYRDRGDDQYRSRNDDRYRLRDDESYRSRDGERYRPREDENKKTQVSDRDRPRNDDRDRPRHEDRDRPRHEDRDRPRHEDRDRPLIDDRDRPLIDDRDRTLINDRDRPRNDDRDRLRNDDKYRSRDDDRYRSRDDDKLRSRDDDRYRSRDDERYRDGSRDDKYRDDDKYRIDPEDRRDIPSRSRTEVERHRPRTDEDKYGDSSRTRDKTISAPDGDRKPSRSDYDVKVEESVADYDISIRDRPRSVVREDVNHSRLPRPSYSEERNRDEGYRKPSRYDDDVRSISPTRTRDDSSFSRSSSIDSRPKDIIDDSRYTDSTRDRIRDDRYYEDDERIRNTRIQDSKSSISTVESSRRYPDESDRYRTRLPGERTEDPKLSDRREVVVIDRRSYASEEDGDYRKTNSKTNGYYEDRTRSPGEDTRRRYSDEEGYSRRDSLLYDKNSRSRDSYDKDRSKSHDDDLRSDDRYRDEDSYSSRAADRLPSTPRRQYDTYPDVDDGRSRLRDPEISSVRREGSRVREENIRPSQSSRDETRLYSRDDIPDSKPRRRYDEDAPFSDDRDFRDRESNDRRYPDDLRKPIERKEPVIGSSMSSVNTREPSDVIIREKRFQSTGNRHQSSRVSSDVSTNERNYRDRESNYKDKSGPASAKDVIDAVIRHTDNSGQNAREVHYPVFDPRVSNLTSPEIIRPNERRGTTITFKKRRSINLIVR